MPVRRALILLPLLFSFQAGVLFLMSLDYLLFQGDMVKGVAGMLVSAFCFVAGYNAAHSLIGIGQRSHVATDLHKAKLG